MDTKINKHVFHGFYSNFGYRPQFSIDRKLANFPIHFYRASYGEKEEGAIKEFKTEEEVLKWYKKNKYGESQFNKLEFPNNFCKNYIVFSEAEFYKYRHLFHGMIKGLKINSDIEIQSQGEAAFPECPSCEEDEEDEEDSDNTPSKTSKYNQKVKFTINFDSSKIFNLEELQKRLPANNFEYKTIVNLEEDKNTEELITFSGEKVFKEEWEFDQKEFKSIFENEKEKFNYNATFINDPVVLSDLNSDGTPGISGPSALNFQKMPISSLKPLMAEIKIQDSAIPNNPLYITIENIFNRVNSGYSDELINKHKNFSKKFEKFNSIEYKFDNSNSIVKSASNYLDFKITDLFYIKEKKSYICFIEIINKINFTGDVVDKPEECPECPESSSSSSSNDDDQSPGGLSSENIDLILSQFLEKSSLTLSTENTEDYVKLGETNILRIECLLTTNDMINDNPPTFKTSACDNNPKKLEFEKTKCTIKLLNTNYEIEIFKLKNNEFSYDNSNCKDFPFAKDAVKINYNKMLSFEILEWKDSDISKTNVFPPKLS
jgi:hypothetical protein